jgi:DNA gyrase subunit A
LSKISDELLQDIEKETVDFVDNFDGSLQEPIVLPCKVPNLLINGSTGIAVGMATNIPPHNLKEVCSAVINLIDNPECSDRELYENVQGPDFPTGGIIQGKAGIIQAYTTGKGKALVKARMKDETHNKQNKIIITEIPYMMSKADLLVQIADCVKDKKIEGISDLRDESDRNGMRIVIELKKDANADVVKNQLYNFTRLQETFGIILLSLVNNRPRVLSLRAMLEEFLKHRISVVRRRTEYDLKKAEEKMHILEGLVIALNHIDEAIEVIKKAGSANEAKEALMKKYALSEIQSQAILDMKLQKIAKLETEKIRKELEDITVIISELRKILSDEKEILKIIRGEQQEIIEKYGDERKTSY